MCDFNFNEKICIFPDIAIHRHTDAQNLQKNVQEILIHPSVYLACFWKEITLVVLFRNTINYSSRHT